MAVFLRMLDNQIVLYSFVFNYRLIDEQINLINHEGLPAK